MAPILERGVVVGYSSVRSRASAAQVDQNPPRKLAAASKDAAGEIKALVAEVAASAEGLKSQAQGMAQAVGWFRMD